MLIYFIAIAMEEHEEWTYTCKFTDQQDLKFKKKMSQSHLDYHTLHVR